MEPDLLPDKHILSASTELLAIVIFTYWNRFFILYLILEQAGGPASQVQYSKWSIASNEDYKNHQDRPCTPQAIIMPETMYQYTYHTGTPAQHNTTSS